MFVILAPTPSLKQIRESCWVVCVGGRRKNTEKKTHAGDADDDDDDCRRRRQYIAYGRATSDPSGCRLQM
jgi:hypothetical protein